VRRGELYLVQHPSSRDPRKQRVIVSRQLLVDSSFSSVICAPVYTRRDGLHTQVDVGVDEGLRHDRSLTNFVGSLTPAKQALLDRALGFRPWSH
jgi:mRNA interferase MazF